MKTSTFLGLLIIICTVAAAFAQVPVEQRFKQWDKNSDGKLTADEAGQFPWFKRSDKNNDGVVTLEEAQAVFGGSQRQPLGASSKSQIKPADDRSSKPAKLAPKSDNQAFLNLRFVQDYCPGARDVNGKWMGGTEALNLAVHKGRLYAGIGYWQDIPYYEDKPGDPWVGSQVLVKEGKDAPWKVDLNMGERVLRARALRSVSFDTDSQGRRLPQPVAILLASGMNFGSPEILTWSRDDDANQWHRTVMDRTKVGDYIVAFGGHRNAMTGVSYVFGGSRNGSVYKGVHDPSAPGKIRWENQPEFVTRDERTDTKNAERRVMGFAEANGHLYASIRTAIYRRTDGPKPDWKEVYRWPLPPGKDGFHRPQGRGLTAIPKPDGRGQMLLMALEMEKVIRHIDPAKGGRAEADFDVGAYFRKAWGSEIRDSLCMAHNRMLSYTIPSTGEEILMFGFSATPRSAPSWNRSGGAGLFIRRANGAYQHFPVEDSSLNPHPRLFATRDVAPSPWEPNVIYACGYDATGEAVIKKRALNTAWIYRGEFQKQSGMPKASPVSPPVTPAPTPAPTPPPSAKADIVQTLDVRYATIAGVNPKFLSLDIHAPKGAKATPVVIYVHGGLWKAGDKGQKGHLPEFLCGRGYVFVSVNYRLAPAAKHPVLIQDVARAVAWVHDHIAEHGGDPAQLFLAGHSAGAHLVALLGTDAKRLGELGKPLSVLRAVIPLDSVAMDIRDVAANDRRSDSPYRGAFGDDATAWADASPIVHTVGGKGLPPFQVIVAYGPAIANKKKGVDEFAAALRKAGTRVEVVDASSFREHQSLMTDFGAPDDPVGKAVLEFIESVRSGTAAAGPGSWPKANPPPKPRSNSKPIARAS